MAEVSGDIEQVITLPKQMIFAAATALTAVAKEAQLAAIQAIAETFHTRNPWYVESSPYGVHITPATKDDLSSEVKSDAWWLVPHETGEDKVAQDGQFLAVPVRGTDARPRRPGSLPNSFVLNTRRGPVIFQRTGKVITPIYGLERRVHIKQQSTIVKPTLRIVDERFADIYMEKLEQALETAK